MEREQINLTIKMDKADFDRLARVFRLVETTWAGARANTGADARSLLRTLNAVMNGAQAITGKDDTARTPEQELLKAVALKTMETAYCLSVFLRCERQDRAASSRGVS